VRKKGFKIKFKGHFFFMSIGIKAASFTYLLTLKFIPFAVHFLQTTEEANGRGKTKKINHTRFQGSSTLFHARKGFQATRMEMLQKNAG